MYIVIIPLYTSLISLLESKKIKVILLYCILSFSSNDCAFLGRYFCKIFSTSSNSSLLILYTSESYNGELIQAISFPPTNLLVK